MHANNTSQGSGSRSSRWSFFIRLTCLGTLVLALGLLAPATSATPILVPNADDGGSGSGSSAAHLTVTRLFGEVFTLQKGEICAELMTAEARHQTPAGRFEGPEGFTAFVGIMWTAFPDAVFVMEEVSESDGMVAVRWSMTGTHLGTLDGQPASGNRVALHGLAQFSFDGDRISASWIEYDRLALIEQVTAAGPSVCPQCRDTP
jgi:steroid delta-isomerase-like uncharacterized protein